VTKIGTNEPISMEGTHYQASYPSVCLLLDSCQ
jgi:hypothetical protein